MVLSYGLTLPNSALAGSLILCTKSQVADRSALVVQLVAVEEGMARGIAFHLLYPNVPEGAQRNPALALALM